MIDFLKQLHHLVHCFKTKTKNFGRILAVSIETLFHSIGHYSGSELKRITKSNFVTQQTALWDKIGGKTPANLTWGTKSW